MNRKLLFGAAIFLAGVNASQASDLPVTYDSDWSGLYATLSAGYSNVAADGEDFDATVPFDNSGSDKDSSDGALLGVGFGYNHDLGDFVIGLEGDISVLTNENQLEMKNTVSAEYDWFATGRARAGYDMDGTLIYATGGVALLGVSYEDDNNADDSDTLVGWTAGGGIEHMLTDTLSVRIEGLYADFGSSKVDLSATDTDIETDMFVARAGLSWRF
jgi:outer membrane immunogenic protein